MIPCKQLMRRNVGLPSLPSVGLGFGFVTKPNAEQAPSRRIDHSGGVEKHAGSNFLRLIGFWADNDLLRPPGHSAKLNLTIDYRI